MSQLILNIESFEKLYSEYYSMLCMVAYDYTRDKMLAEDIIGEMFVNLWEKRDSLSLTFSLKAYLIKSAKNACLQHFRKRKIEIADWDTEVASKYIPWGSDYPLDLLFEKELAGIINKTVDNLPPQCRKIFLLSRNEEMSYSQIAEELNISENTVKTQIKTSLSRIRFALKDYYI